MTSELRRYLCKEMKNQKNKMIRFVEFMAICLYHQDLGYYMKQRNKVGKKGDFYTSSQVSNIFGETLSDSILLFFKDNEMINPVLMEVGGGTGGLMEQVLTRIREVDAELYARLRVIMVEISPYHAHLQKERLQDFSLPKIWYKTVEEAARNERFQGVIFSNEYFDAFPVHLLERVCGKWHEIGIGFDQKLGTNTQQASLTTSDRKQLTDSDEAQAVVFQEGYMSEISPEIMAIINKLPKGLPDGMRIEVQAGVKEVMIALSSMLERGRVISIDYGDLTEDLYHPSRKNGTLACYYQHQMNEDYLERLGEQDITAHVNFSRLIEYGAEAGLLTKSFTRQDQFLLANGILDKAQAHQDADPFTSVAMKRNRAIQQLILPSGMGGLFRVLIQEKLMDRERK
ncbi:class I SAM-dependent methyltransferase [Brevibacillus laterosporus]|uniref:class I SAM-dependent methyltransferase n=1 Tax=Brevibacillus laterosporus TaxID=1465 RepID=UPI002654B529|nr:SAM-dependent methyltransferase [Brevibacillus laterosporus]MDN9012242.1 SAM-dependent methyltransferase [Brevibacillus laterosporus]MDO0943338.1 SAM-dependent methyltransferase [Brevibacillus laterosporus]